MSLVYVVGNVEDYAPDPRRTRHGRLTATQALDQPRSHRERASLLPDEADQLAASISPEPGRSWQHPRESPSDAAASATSSSPTVAPIDHRLGCHGADVSIRLAAPVHISLLSVAGSDDDLADLVGRPPQGPKPMNEKYRCPLSPHRPGVVAVVVVVIVGLGSSVRVQQRGAHSFAMLTRRRLQRRHRPTRDRRGGATRAFFEATRSS